MTIFDLTLMAVVLCLAAIAFGRGGNFKVRLHDNRHVIKARCGGRLNRNKIKVGVGDVVRVELSPYDLDRGRIVFRWPACKVTGETVA